MDGLKNSLFALLMLLFIGCYSDKHKVDVIDNQHLQFVNFNRQIVDVLTIDTVDVRLTINKRNHNSIFEYENSERKEVFKINFNDATGFVFYGKDSVILHFLDKRDLVIVELIDTISIYKFITLSSGVDGASYLYFTPDLGLILRKSTTWPIFSELLNHYLDPDNVFKLILSFIYNDRDFFDDIIPEAPPPAPVKR